jgi:uncharacterized protein (TIGR03067 family)
MTILLAVGVGARAGDVEAKKKFIEKLQGEWQMVKLETGGKPALEETVANWVMIFDKDTIDHRREGKGRKEKLTFKVDASKKPIALDIFAGKEDEKGVRGIIELEGDTLKICTAFHDGERPTEFVSPAGQRITLFKLKRSKK